MTTVKAHQRRGTRGVRRHWRYPKMSVRESSIPGAGLGIFADEDIPAGTVVSTTKDHRYLFDQTGFNWGDRGESPEEIEELNVRLAKQADDPFYRMHWENPPP
jgi:hypothetical protein